MCDELIDARSLHDLSTPLIGVEYAGGVVEGLPCHLAGIIDDSEAALLVLKGMTTYNYTSERFSFSLAVKATLTRSQQHGTLSQLWRVSTKRSIPSRGTPRQW